MVTPLSGDKPELSPGTFRILVESAGDVVYLLDSEGTITWLNPAFERATGWSMANWIGKSASMLLHPDDVPLSDSMSYLVMRGEVSPAVELRIISKSGDYLEAEVTVAPLFSDGKVIGGVGIGRDITRRKQLERSLRLRKEIEHALARVSSRFVGAVDVDDAINRSLAEIGRMSGVDRAYLVLLQDNGTATDNTHEWCAEGVTPQKDNLQNVPTDATPWSISRFRSGEAIAVDDVSTLPSEAAAERQMLESQGVKSIVCVPVMVRGEFAGFVGFDNVRGTGSWQNPSHQPRCYANAELPRSGRAQEW